MEENRILLGEFKNVDSINTEINQKVELERTFSNLQEFDLSSIIDVAQRFDRERQASNNYRVYGKLEYLSILNGLKKDYTTVNDFFTKSTKGEIGSGLTKNFIEDFDVYLTKLATGNIDLSGNTFITQYEVLTKLDQFEIINAGYHKNLFNEQEYIIDFNKNFNISGLADSFGKPIMDFYLYFQYKPDTVSPHSETLSRTEFSTSAGTPSRILFIPETLNPGDIITGDFVSYEKKNFLESVVTQQQYFITTPYDTDSLVFEYNPFVDIPLRVFEDNLQIANLSGSSETAGEISIPSYAVEIDNNGNVVWKDILDIGFIEPLSGAGIDPPFVNDSHYLFSNTILGIQPDLTDTNTSTVFAEILFAQNSLIANKPQNDIANFGDKC